MLLRDFVDVLPGSRRTTDGYLVVEGRVARAGNVQVYSGTELGMPDHGTVRVFRPEEEVFDRASLASYAHRPITIDHPESAIDATSWRRHVVGHVGGDVVRDGEFVVTVVLTPRRSWPDALAAAFSEDRCRGSLSLLRGRGGDGGRGRSAGAAAQD